ncbi:TPA: DUF58 domain-containing protein [Candidatus Marinimicrobia bacterium]|nr:MAG: hypothetical protein XD77_0171 [Marinimicrobia bacterium 46_47]KUK93863.1 MAG: hypothetical protein XE04_0011 [Marinimicrobia bacterium 46_43]HAE86562.1 DUF58 domain-containing protein [Candidatus Neomarinimicrobiota bacterium]HBY18652.1 DUF58 domain-containing protein [Candidatus Neomarinimicrobiota bacterium]
MLSGEILRKVRQIEIQTRRAVNEVFAGEYKSVFRGQGMEFSEVREYQIGDDIRRIDWNVTARFSHPYIRIMDEERELTVYFAVDISSSTQFGTAEQFKSELAAEVCSVLSFSAIRNGDKVGMISFNDRIEKYIPPRKGKSNAMRVIREILFGEHRAGKTDINGSLQYLFRVARKKSVVFIVSDFYDLDFNQSLKPLANKHDVILLHVVDPIDRALPDLGFITFMDPESGEMRIVDTGDKNIREQYALAFAERSVRLDKMAKNAKADLITLHTDQSYLEPLANFFRMRGKLFH